MFFRSFIPTALLAAALAASPAMAQAPANDTVKGAALMAEARKALGGEDKLAAVKRLEVKAEFTQVTANQTLDGDVTMMLEGPDKYRRDEEIFLPGGSITITRTLALNVADAWEVTEGGLPGGFGGRGGRGGDFGGRGRLGGVLGGAVGGEPTPATQDPARQAALREQQRRTRQTELTRFLVAFLTATPETPAWVGTAVTPKDEKADVLEFKTADDTVTRLFLDITTHVPLMMTYSGPAPRGQGRQGGEAGGFRGRRGGGDGAAGAPPAPPPVDAAAAAPAQAGGRGGAVGQPTTVEIYIGDYKVDGGVKIPRHITREINGEIQEELRIKSVKLNPNFKPNTFVQPKQ
jgi:H/ACA ribonucleoprotein complex subunit 1